jgi:hypothetical protein
MVQLFKPFFGFGWIETSLLNPEHSPIASFKPFFGFGWIETHCRIATNIQC